MVCDFCNENDFPLFVVPWHIHMPEIMLSISTMLAESEKETDISELSEALTQAVFHPEKEKDYRTALNALGFGMNNILQIAFADPNTAELPPIPHGCSAVRLNIKGKKIFALCGFSKTELKRFSNACTQNSIPMYIGISVKNISLLHKSYSSALALFEHRNALPNYKNGIIFEDTGIFGLIVSVNGPSITERFYEESLGILRKYDKNYKSCCCESLKAYLMHNSSIKDASEELGIHKNTLLNRLHKVEELLDGDLSDLMFKCRLITAFVIERIREN